jgi:hypothetical protein
MGVIIGFTMLLAPMVFLLTVAVYNVFIRLKKDEKKIFIIVPCVFIPYACLAYWLILNSK